ncbi:AlpA family phage regulatory protein [Denitromonas sp. IR12]|uniref:AlpA family phage regulatory protein n=2 Tax=Denitromonas iodatirespirans TaxID=2795389 RepID=A0A944DGX7_DENI1|nr:AlpA family phage regulatory protein [Denitromonas iodatirespirans]
MFRSDASCERLLQFPEVKRLTGLGRSSCYKLIRAGLFPRPVELGVVVL